MRAKGTWNMPQVMNNYSYDRWEGQAVQNLCTIPINALSTPLDSSHLIPLDFDLRINDCIALVIRRDISEQPAIHQLLDDLQQQLRKLALEHPQLSTLN